MPEIADAPAPAALSLQQFLAAYPPASGHYDEFLDADGQVRPHYAEIVRQMLSEADTGFASRRRAAESIIRRDGITYNVYGDPKGLDRPWALDLLPVILTTAEWARIEAGIRQRVYLLNHLLADLYGAQHLIRQRVLPAEFTMGNPRFLRACAGLRPPKAGHLVRYAADLVRGPDGQWQVYSDRTQTPSGAGYSLENRIVMARTYPNLIQDAYVQRLANFFEHFSASLRTAGPPRREDPSIVMLTPGPMNETYFEQVYLARYLGYPLVEGEDLAMRDNRLYLRTVQGLEPVDVVLRYVDDAFCDPLELRHDSILGPIGLLQAIRSGNVSVCNAVGSGAIEVPALKAVLPRLCRYALGEELLLPCTKTYWGGQADDRAWMETQLDPARLIAAFGSRNLGPASVRPETIDARLQRWRERPHEFVMSEDPAISTVPVLHGPGVVPRSLVLRIYATINGDTGEIQVMPGGLARFSESRSVGEITMQHGSGSKDVWVLSPGPVEYRGQLRNPNAPVALVRSPRNLPSRMAENLLWLGRYCERTEHTVRLLRHVLIRTTEDDWLHERDDIRRLVESQEILLAKIEGADREWGDLDAQSEEETRAGARARVDAVHHAIIETMKDAEHPSGIAAMVYAIRRALWIVRERFSEDDWRIMNSVTQDFLDRSSSTWTVQGTIDAFNDLVTGFAAFSGLCRENMTREPGQFFLEMGRRVERGINLIELVQRCLVTPLENEASLLASLLAVFDSPMTYRARYGTTLQPAAVLDLLLADETNPRAVAYQINRLATHLPLLPRSGGGGLLNVEQRVLERMRADLRTTDMNTLARIGEDGTRAALNTFTTYFEDGLPHFSDLISQRYFIHTEPAQHLGTRMEARA